MKLYDRIESIIPAPPGLVKVYAWDEADEAGVYPVVALALVIKDDGYREPVQAIIPVSASGDELSDPLREEPEEYEGVYNVAELDEVKACLVRRREYRARQEKEAAEKTATGQ